MRYDDDGSPYQADEADQRAEIRAATRAENLALAEEKAAREAAWRAMQAEADARELAAREVSLKENMGHQFDPASGRLQKVRRDSYLLHLSLNSDTSDDTRHIGTRSVTPTQGGFA